MMRRILFEMRLSAYALHLGGYIASAEMLDRMADEMAQAWGLAA